MEKMSIPEGLDVSQQADAVVIRRSWRNLMVLPVFLFLIPWFGFLGFWYYHAFTAKHSPPMMFLFPLFHVAAGVGLGYFAVASLVNATNVSISTTSVSSKTGPLPWWGDRSVPAEAVRGLIVRERRGNRGSVSYALMYVDAANKERPLLSPTPRREQADFIAASIRTLLGLTESPSAS